MKERQEKEEMEEGERESTEIVQVQMDQLIDHLLSTKQTLV